MERLKETDGTDGFLLAVDVVDFMRGRPKTFPSIFLLFKPAELLYGEVVDACWSTNDNTVEILTKCGELFVMNPDDRIRKVRPVEVEVKMNYFSLEFGYIGPVCDVDGSGREANAAICSAEDVVDEIAAKVKDQAIILHQYSYPDGSCYKYARTTLSESELTALIKPLLRTPIHDCKVTETSASEDPHKVGSATLEDYFNKHEKESSTKTT